MIDHSLKSALKYKAKALKTSPEYSAYVEEVLKELAISDAKEAFILGAIDAIISGLTLSTNVKGLDKSSLLKEIMDK